MNHETDRGAFEVVIEYETLTRRGERLGREREVEREVDQRRFERRQVHLVPASFVASRRV